MSEFLVEDCINEIPFEKRLAVYLFSLQSLRVTRLRTNGQQKNTFLHCKRARIFALLGTLISGRHMQRLFLFVDQFHSERMYTAWIYLG